MDAVWWLRDRTTAAVTFSGLALCIALVAVDRTIAATFAGIWLTVVVGMAAGGVTADSTRRPARPGEGLRESGRTAVVTWLAVVLVGGLATSVMIAVVRSVVGVSLSDLAVDGLLVFWLIGLSLAVLGGGLLLLSRDCGWRRPGLWASAVIAFLAGGAAWNALNRWRWLGELHPWAQLFLLMAVMAVVLAGLVRFHHRVGAYGRKLVGGFLVAFALSVHLRLLEWMAGWDGSPVFLVQLLFAVGSLVCLRVGGAAWLRQQTLRRVLAHQPEAPRDLPAFLDAAENRGLLWRAGTYYLFPHLLVQKFFADRADAPARNGTPPKRANGGKSGASLSGASAG